MCGIAGIVDFGKTQARETYLSRLNLAMDQIARRGPDGSGIWSDELCVMGHRRLAIVDLTPSGHQPMTRNGFVISFNGMIFNYREIREELLAAGCNFLSKTDTEVILEGWRLWGPDLLPKLNGFFAFAIWDTRQKELVIARDRFGEKPLFWKRQRAGIAFASSLFSCLILAKERSFIDPEALSAYLALKYVPEPLCIVADYQKLQPGHFARIREGHISVHQWYNLAPNNEVLQLSPSDQPAYLREVISSAVNLRLIADVPVGAFLSGGIDSSIVAAAAGPTIKTFTIGFESKGGYFDERADARFTASHIGTEHFEESIDPYKALEKSSAVFDALDEPFADSSAIPTFLVCETIRKHVTVALSGDGGDELFGGYRRHQGELWAAVYRRLPSLLRKGLIEPVLAVAPQDKDVSWSNALRIIQRFVSAGADNPVERHAGWMRAMSSEQVNALTTQSFDLVSRVAVARENAPFKDPISQTLFGDISILLPSQMLPKIDRLSMANALEVRPPMLDYRVVEAAIALPPYAKVKRGKGKAILREAFSKHLPSEVFNRPKRGFEFPIGDWLRSGPGRILIEDAISPSALVSLGLGTTAPSEWLAQLDAGRPELADMLWSIVALNQWYNRYRALPC